MEETESGPLMSESLSQRPCCFYCQTKGYVNGPVIRSPKSSLEGRPCERKNWESDGTVPGCVKSVVIDSQVPVIQE